MCDIVLPVVIRLLVMEQLLLPNFVICTIFSVKHTY